MLTLLRETIEDILITWIGLHKKSSSIQTFVEDIPEIKSHWSLLSKTYRNLHFINSNSHCFEHFVFHPHDRLVPLHIFSYRESTVGAPISSLAVHKILFFFLLACKADSNFEIYLQYSRDFQHKTVNGIFVQFSKKLQDFTS